jgi:hypothetical protein
VISVETGFAEILISLIGEAVINDDEAEVSVDRQSWKIFMTENTQAETIILKTVTDSSFNTRSPVWRLSVSVGTTGAQVCSWNVQKTIGDFWETNSIDKHG